MGFGGEMKNPTIKFIWNLKGPFPNRQNNLEKKVESLIFINFKKKTLLLKEAVRYHKSRKEEQKIEGKKEKGLYKLIINQ